MNENKNKVINYALRKKAYLNTFRNMAHLLH